MIRLVGIFMNDDVRHVCVERKLQAIRGPPVICRVRRQDQLWNMVADLTGSETRIAGEQMACITTDRFVSPFNLKLIQELNITTFTVKSMWTKEVAMADKPLTDGRGK